MHRRFLVPCLATVAAAALIALPAGASPTASDTTATGGSNSYLVLYADGASPEAARAAIAEAGGTVVDENASVGLAEVISTDAGFLSKARAHDAVKMAARNRSIGTARPGMGHKFKDERLDEERAARRGQAADVPTATAATDAEPLSSLQWDMQMINATPEGSYAVEPGDPGVLVGIIDTGIDGSHPDIADNFNAGLSRNFTEDIPAIDGPCEDEPDQSCTDPADVDENSHGTHVAGTVASPADGFGMAGVAPEVQLVNLRAGQDSGYFFLEESISAFTYAADNGIDVVNMSYYIDPWLYNCPSADEYAKAEKGHPTSEEIAEQALVIAAVDEAVAYALERNVTFVAAAGNGHTDLSAELREDDTSPDFALDGEGNLIDAAYQRTVTKECLDLPSEAPGVISVASVGPSGQKADYSNWGIDEIDVAAPGGWFRDGLGTATHRTPENMILGPYPENVGRELGDIDEAGEPTNPFVIKQCDTAGCAYYQWIQGTSMASPHATGVAALIVSHFGTADAVHGGLTLDPDVVRSVLKATAADHACTDFNYARVGRTPASEWGFKCEGSTAYNNIYGDGIIDALAAVGG